MTGFASLVRFFHLGFSALLLGALGFVALIAYPTFRKAGPEISPAFQGLVRSHLRLASWSLLGLFLTSLLSLGLQIATASGLPLFQSISWDTVGDILRGTQYGIVWSFRLLCLLGLAGLLAILLRREENALRNGLQLIALALAAAMMMAPALSGHAAAGEGRALVLQLIADALHLAAAGLWLGGLVPLADCLRRIRKHGSPAAAVAAQETTRRFSLLGLVCVSTLVMTGLWNAWHLVGALPPLVGTTYGRLLIMKLGVLIPLTALAAYNLLCLKPKLLLSPANFLREDFGVLLSRLRRNVLAEVCLGACILFIVGAMGVTPPARHIAPDWPFSFRWSWTAVKGSAKIRSQLFAGGSMATFGLLALFCAWFRRADRPWLTGAGLTGLGYGGMVALSAMSIDAYPTTYRRPLVPYHAISIANGARLYRDSCAVCHGVAGYGDGPAADGLKPKPADLTAKHTRDHTVGDLFWWLTEGIKGTAMPGFQASLTEEERWDLINFMRTIAAAEQARPMAALAEPDPWLVAPDFVYRTVDGEGKTLKDHRGQSVVLLVLFTLPHSQKRLAQLDQAHARLNEVGVRVIAVPWDADRISDLAGRTVRYLPVITDGSQEAFAAYALFRRSFSAEGTRPDPPIPPHMELLIDRQGYVRARWIPWDGAGWTSLDRLLREIDRLNQEKPSAPAPDEHVH